MNTNSDTRKGGRHRNIKRTHGIESPLLEVPSGIEPLYMVLQTIA